MSGEHASRQLIDDYARGDATMAADTVWALEAHLETCALCRSHLAACVATEAPGIAALVDTVRAGLEPQLDAAVRAPSRRHRPRWVAAWLTPVMAPWLVMTVLVTLMAVGLGGWAVVLERTAAIRWMPRRAAHVLLAGACAGAALLTVQAAGVKLAPAEVVVRDSAGLVGLAALGAALCGAQFAWTLPTGWLAFTLFGPPPGGTAGDVVMWMIYSPATTASTGTAWALFAIGTVVYAIAGPRR